MKERVIIKVSSLMICFLCLMLLLTSCTNKTSLDPDNYKYFMTYSTSTVALYNSAGETHLISVNEDSDIKIVKLGGMEGNGICLLKKNIVLNIPAASVIFNKKGSKKLSAQTTVNGGCYPQGMGVMNDGFYSLLNKGLNRQYDDNYISVLRYGTADKMFERKINGFICCKGDNGSNEVFLLKRESPNRTLYFSVLTFNKETVAEYENLMFSYPKELDYMVNSNMLLIGDYAYFLVFELNETLGKTSLQLWKISLQTKMLSDKFVILTCEIDQTNSLYLMNNDAIYSDKSLIYFVLQNGSVYTFDTEVNSCEFKFILENYNHNGENGMIAFKNNKLYFFHNDINIDKYSLSGNLESTVQLKESLNKSSDTQMLFLYDFHVK